MDFLFLMHTLAVQGLLSSQPSTPCFCSIFKIVIEDLDIFLFDVLSNILFKPLCLNFLPRLILITICSYL